MIFRKRLRQGVLALSILICGISLQAQTLLDLTQHTKGDLPLSRLSKTGAQISYCLQIDGSFAVVWAACPGGGGGGSGTVTTFSAGTLSPLFITSVANPTTTPALSFTLSNFAAHGFLGNNTGISAAPAVVQPKSTDLADFSATSPSSSGKIPIWDQPSGTYIPGDPLVQGLVADGSTTAENPVAIGGYDTAGTPALHRATFINGTPAGTEYGIVVRNVPSGTQTISGSVSVSNFPATQPISGTVTANQGGTWTVQPGNTANTTAWKVDGSAVTQPVSGTVTTNIGTSGSLALDASVTGLEVAQASTTSGQKGALVQGAVTTNPPTYTTAQSDPISLTTSGAVRSDETSIAGTATLTGNGTTGAGSQRVTIASDNTAFAVNNTQQGTASQNVAQFGGTNVSTGTGAGGAGIPRVTVSNDSSMVGTLADNGAAAGTNRFATLPAIYQTSYLNGTAATQGRNGALSQGTDGLLWTASLPAIRPASFAASATVTSAASATDIAVMPGNASNTALLTRIRVSCTQTTAGIVTLNIIKRSAADTAGTSAAMTVVQDDSNTSAGVSAPLTYTANPTTGTTVGNVDTVKVGCMATGTTSPNDIYILNRQQKPLVLRGTAQQIAVNLGGTTVTGGSFAITFEWIETATITP